MTVPSLSRMTLLWSGIVIVALCMGFGGRWMHDRYYDDAFAKATQDAQRANDAAVEHSLQVIDQADTLLRAVRAHPPISKTAFIMLTGRADRELVQQAVQFGVNNYLVKPFTVAQLKGKLEAVFGALT